MRLSIRDMIHSAPLRRILRFYLFGFLIPFALLSALILRYTLNQFGEQSLGEQTSDAVYAMSCLDKWQDTFESIITQMEFNGISRSVDLSLHSGRRDVQQALQMLTAAHDGLIAIWYWSPDSEYLLSGDDSMSLSRLESGRFDTLPSSYGLDIGKTLLSGESLRVFDKQFSKNVVLFPFSITSSITLIFELETSALTNVLDKLLDGNTGCAQVIRLDGTPLIAVSNGLDFDSVQSAFDNCVTAVDARGYRVFGAHSRDPFSSVARFITRVDGARLSIFCVRESRVSTMLRVQQMLTMLLGCMLSLGLLFTVGVAYKLYKPIRTIRASMERHELYPDIQADDMPDDYEYIESCLENVVSSNRHLIGMLASHAENARTFLLSMLLSGKVHDMDEFQDACNSFGFALRANAYSILSIICGRDEIKIVKQRVNAAERQGTVILTQRHAHGLVAFLSPGDDDMRAQIILPEGCVAGFSQTTRSYSEAPVRYVEAMFACAPPPRDCEDTIRNAQAAFHAAYAARDIEPLREWRNSVSCEWRAAAYTLAGCIVDFLHMHKNAAIDDASIFYIPTDVSNERALMSVDQLIQFLARAFTQDGDETCDTLTNMLNYIAREYDSPNFSIKRMALDFSMSISTLSAYFKKHTGRLLSDYITERKMNRAKQLLSDTELSINDVSLAVGYYNANSFIRRFNQMECMTPTEYRLAHRNG